MSLRVGLLARSDNTGLGIQSKEFYDHIPCKALVIDMTEMSTSPIITPHLNRFLNCHVVKMRKGFRSTGGIDPQIIRNFIRDIDVLFCMETPYDYNIFEMCRRRGIKTILQLNYEFLDYPSNLPPPDLFAAPSMWYYDNIPNPKKFLPVPVNTRHFHPIHNKNTFVHIAGRPAHNDRNGTQIFIEALRNVRNKINVIVRSQQPINLRNRNGNVNLIVDNSNKENYWENYVGGGVLVMPRKYGGLCLPANEGIASGMPVIMPNISPNNTWLPSEWLVPAQEQGILNCKQRTQMFATVVSKLTKKIDEFCDDGFYLQGFEKAKALRETISWDILLPLYYQTFNEL